MIHWQNRAADNAPGKHVGQCCFEVDSSERWLEESSDRDFSIVGAVQISLSLLKMDADTDVMEAVQCSKIIKFSAFKFPLLFYSFPTHSTRRSARKIDVSSFVCVSSGRVYSRPITSLQMFSRRTMR